MSEHLPRRDLLRLSAVGILASAVTACTPTQEQDLEKKFADIITQVQGAVKAACGLVPTASSVLAVLVAIIGTGNAVGATAAAIVQAIEFISKACPAPSGAPRVGGAINGKDVVVNFY